MGPPKQFKGEHVKFGLKFRVCAPITLGVVAVTSQNFSVGHAVPITLGLVGVTSRNFSMPACVHVAPKWNFLRDYISAHRGCWPLKFLHALEIDQGGRVEFTGRHRNTLRPVFYITTIQPPIYSYCAQ